MIRTQKDLAELKPRSFSSCSALDKYRRSTRRMQH
jgi:hypothetical protein